MNTQLRFQPMPDASMKLNVDSKELARVSAAGKVEIFDMDGLREAAASPTQSVIRAVAIIVLHAYELGRSEK